MSHDDPILQIGNVSKSFGDNHVLKGIDLELYPAENVVVLGRSGSGKSVLIKIVVALLQPDEGTVLAFGQDVHALSRRDLDDLRVRIGFSFQHSALYDSMSVRDNVAFPLRMNRPDQSDAEIRGAVEQVVEAVGLIDTLDQMPSELSGGQRKRIGIARTLILRPEIMLYDEPTAGLDPSTCGEINELILRVREEYDTASIVITHDLTCAQQVGDRIAMLVDGEILREGAFEEVFDTSDDRIRPFYDYNFVQRATP